MVDLSKASITPDEIIDFLKRDIKFQEMCRKVLSQRVINQAAQERDIKVTPEEIQAEADRLRYEKRLEKAEDTLTWLAEQMISLEDWEAGICDRLLSQKLAECLFSKEVEKFFNQNRLTFEQVRLYEITVLDDLIAQELLYQIEEQEISFQEAAKLYNLEKDRYECGYRNKVERWKLQPDIEAAIFSKNIGEVIGPIKTEQGYHLFMVEEFIPAELTPVRYQDILNTLFQEWLKSELNYLICSKEAIGMS